MALDATAPVTAEIQSLSPTAMIELFVLDARPVGGEIAHFHAGTNELRQPLYWQGVEYLPLPVESEGFDVSAQGTLPRPKLRVANIQGVFSAELRKHDDLIGAVVVRKRTFSRYLDARNFPGGINPSADPEQHLPDDLWFVDQKVREDRFLIEWELASAFDLQGVMLPRRQVIQNSCPWVYRGPDCGWRGGFFSADDQPAFSEAEDRCGKRLSSCRVRFQNGGVIGDEPVSVPFGGFPGAVRV